MKIFQILTILGVLLDQVHIIGMDKVLHHGSLQLNQAVGVTDGACFRPRDTTIWGTACDV